MGGDETRALWLEYRKSGDRRVRDRLFLTYAPIVKYVAGRLGAGLPAHVDDNDLVSAGLMGLIDAIDKYRLDLGVKFETYAIPRVRGAIYDELRKLDWVPRSVRSQERQLRRAMTELEAKHGRAATDKEIAQKMGIPEEELNELLLQMTRHTLASLDTPVSTEEGEFTVGEVIVDPNAPDPQVALSNADRREAVAEAIARLPEREKLVLTLYYYEELTLREIGEVLNVTESRVSQLHTKAMMRVKARLTSPSVDGLS